MAEASRKNLKAEKFAAFIKEHKYNYFQRQDIHDSMDTVSFITAVPVENHRLLGAIITDNSLYTLIRIHLGTVRPDSVSYKSFMQMVNRINSHHATFKIVASSTGEIFLDICFVTTDEHFDPKTVKFAFDFAVMFLMREYKDILPHLDKAGNAETGISLSVC